MPARYLDDDFVTLRRSRDSRQTPFATLAFGDAVEVLDDSDPAWTKVRALDVFDGIADRFTVEREGDGRRVTFAQTLTTS